MRTPAPPTTAGLRCNRCGATEPQSPCPYSDVPCEGRMTTVDTITAWAPQRQQVREALSHQGMSQAKLARKIGVTAKHMSQMLTGAVDGKFDHWVAMATALGLEWQLRPPNPSTELADWAHEHLGLDMEPWQAARLRAFVAERL